MNAALLRRKLRSGFIRLRLARDAIALGGRTAITGVKKSFDLSNTKPVAAAAALTIAEPGLDGVTPPPAAPAPFPPEPPQLDKAFAFALTLTELQMRPPPRVRPRTPRPKRVVMFAVSQLRIDPRIEREARALVEAGFEVIVVGPDLSEPSNAQVPLDWGPNIKFDLLPSLAVGFMVNAPWFYSAPLVRAGSRHEAFAFHAHDLWTSLIALDCASRTGALAVMDYHEWTSENVSWDSENQRWAPHPVDRGDAFRNMENLGMRLAALTITVNKTIATALEQECGLAAGSVAIVRNVPKLDAVPTKTYPSLKKQFGLADSAFVVLYQGGTGPSRLLEPVIEGLAHAPGAILIIRGPSLDLFGDEYRALAARCGVADRLIIAPAVPSHDVVAAARGADLGIYTVVDASKNFRYALPNKVFEYLAADVPLAIANYPEVMKIVDEHKCGVSFDPHSPRSIGAAIHSVQSNPAFRKELQRNAPVAFEALDGASEWRRFAALYEELWRRATAPESS